MTTGTTAEDLLELAGRLGEVRRALRVGVRTPIARELPLALRSSWRTHDRFGVRGFLPGDSVRSLILRDLVARNQWNVRTFHVLAEANVRVVLDRSRSLLSHPATGRFARRLAFVLAALGVQARQPTTVSCLGAAEGSPSVTRRTQLGVFADLLARVSSVPTDPLAGVALLRAALQPFRSNTNLFLVLRVGIPLDVLAGMLDVAQERSAMIAVFSVLSADELDPDQGPVIDPESGTVLPSSPDRVSLLCDYLDACVRLGRTRGVSFSVLVIRDAVADLDALLPWLGEAVP
jgi:hypothetical protein